MVDPEDPDDVLRLTEGILKTVVSRDPKSQQPSAKRDLLRKDIVADDDLVDDLIDCLDGHDPCPLECDYDEGECIVRLRRKNTISNFVGGLRKDDQNPLEL